MGDGTVSVESELSQERDAGVIRVSLANGRNLGLCELSGKETCLYASL